MMNLNQLFEQAVSAHKRGNLRDAERLYGQIIALDTNAFAPRNLLGVILAQSGRHPEALAMLGAALKINPNDSGALSNYASVQATLGRNEEALASLDKALALRPGHPGTLYNRGNILQALDRFEEALKDYDQALAGRPDFPEALLNRGNALQQLKRLEEALASFEKAVVPGFPEALNSKGLVLQHMKRLEDALDSYDRALALRPDYPEALNNRAKALFESNRVEEGLQSFRRSAALVYGADPLPPETSPEPQKTRHDREQRAWIAAQPPGAAPGARVPGQAVNAGNVIADISEQWNTNKPQIVVIDDFLTPAALEELRRYCKVAPVWRRAYGAGYLGATPEYGFACPLLAQIADELRATYPAIFKAHPLGYVWGFKYDSALKGIEVHADEAAVNVNFWITPDEANRNPETGGLVVWDVAAPLDWNFSRFNGSTGSIREFLARNGASSVRVPHRANRAVIFDSDLFHETDTIDFAEGYENRRVNVTLLYGRRQ